MVGITLGSVESRALSDPTPEPAALSPAAERTAILALASGAFVMALNANVSAALLPFLQGDATKFPKSGFVASKSGRHTHVENPEFATPYDRLLKFSKRGTVVVTDSKFKKGHDEPYLANSRPLIAAGEHAPLRAEGNNW